MKSKLAIFDLDGTLTNSVSIHQTCFIEAILKFGLSDFDTNWSNYKHHTDSYIFKTILESQFERSISENDIEQFENILQELIHNSTLTDQIHEISGAKYFINELINNSDFDIVLATGSLLKPAKLKLQQAGFSVNDDLIIASNTIFTRDDLLLKAIEQAKNFYSIDKYEHIVSFGDGYWDYIAAKNRDIDFIGIGNRKLKDHVVKSFFDNFTDLNLHKLFGMEQKSVFPDFEIKSLEAISRVFIEAGILNFHQAIDFTKRLPYGRNKDKRDLKSLFTERCGTCGTKHALLKQLAIENDFRDIKLTIGLFRMNAINTPEISQTLSNNNIEYVPEAHCYLKYNELIIDCTKEHSSPDDFINDIIEETEILPEQITEYKVAYQKEYIENWLKENSNIKFTLTDFWAIREQCIEDLTNKQ